MEKVWWEADGGDDDDDDDDDDWRTTMPPDDNHGFVRVIQFYQTLWTLSSKEVTKDNYRRIEMVNMNEVYQHMPKSGKIGVEEDVQNIPKSALKRKAVVGFWCFWRSSPRDALSCMALHGLWISSLLPSKIWRSRWEEMGWSWKDGNTGLVLVSCFFSLGLTREKTPCFCCGWVAVLLDIPISHSV